MASIQPASSTVLPSGSLLMPPTIVILIATLRGPRVNETKKRRTARSGSIRAARTVASGRRNIGNLFECSDAAITIVYVEPSAAVR